EKDDPERFTGAWKLASGAQNGEDLPQNLIDMLKMTFKEGKVTIDIGGKEIEGEYQLDPTAKPKRIEFKTMGKAILGIYQLDGDELKLCFRDPGSDGRPEEFTGAAGSNNILILLKREAAKPKEEKKEGQASALGPVTAADFAGCCME